MIKKNRFKIVEVLEPNIEVNPYKKGFVKRFIVIEKNGFFSRKKFIWTSYYRHAYTSEDYFNAKRFNTLGEAQEAIINLLFSNAYKIKEQKRRKQENEEEQRQIVNLTKDFKTYSVPPFIKIEKK